MKISYNWLKEYVDFSMTAEELGEALTLVGFEVEDVVRKGLDLPGVLVGKVLSKAKHPDADKLSLCTVTVGGDRELPIVCGAPNVAVGQLVPVATVGAELPGGFKIRKAKIRGEVSEGMICSEAELGISDAADGIWVLPEGTRWVSRWRRRWGMRPITCSISASPPTGPTRCPISGSPGKWRPSPAIP